MKPHPEALLRRSLVLAVVILLLAVTAAQAAVTLVEFKTERLSPTSVRVAWRTATETDTIGFFLWRAEAQDGAFAQVAQFESRGSGVSGADYEFIDTGLQASRNYWYRLEDLDGSQSSTYHGPIPVDPITTPTTAPTATVSPATTVAPTSTSAPTATTAPTGTAAATAAAATATPVPTATAILPAPTLPPGVTPSATPTLLPAAAAAAAAATTEAIDSTSAAATAATQAPAPPPGEPAASPGPVDSAGQPAAVGPEVVAAAPEDAAGQSSPSGGVPEQPAQPAAGSDNGFTRLPRPQTPEENTSSRTPALLLTVGAFSLVAAGVVGALAYRSSRKRGSGR